jgi:glycosyltransferase involved in cell wall biosynthesis
MATARRAIRVLYITCLPVRFIAFEWVARELDRDRFDLSFLLLGEEEGTLGRYLKAQGIPVHYLPYRGRIALIGAARAVARHCRALSVDVVHTHFMDGCLAGLLGAWFAGVQVRLHTRHHAGPYPLYHRAPWGTWYDRWNNYLSTCIVAPSEQARRTLIDHDRVPQRKVVVIPHGFDLEVFSSLGDADALRMRAKHRLGDDRPIIGVVARYERIKGVEYVIPAFAEVLAHYPLARLVLANARGNWAQQVRCMLEVLPRDRYTEIVFEEDMPALYKTFDVFVHAPLRPWLESFGQVYVEAMAAGVPCVCTTAGIAGEFMVDGVNALLVESKNSGQIRQGIVRILKDPALRERLVANARRSVEERFCLGQMIRSLEDLYTRLFESHGARRR